MTDLPDVFNFPLPHHTLSLSHFKKHLNKGSTSGEKFFFLENGWGELFQNKIYTPGNQSKGNPRK